MRIKNIEFLIGADPEVFVWDREELKYVGGYKFTKGTKTIPESLVYPVESWVQADGMAVEFNTRPTETFSFLHREVQNCLTSVAERILKGNSRYELVSKPTVFFDEEEWALAPEENRNLGCDPDYCAWTGRRNPTPDKKVMFRTGAGHIHIGWTENVPTTPDFMTICCELTKALDASIGIYSVIHDEDIKRKELYGKAGAFRPKPYGLEYRVLSNFWVGDEKMTKTLSHKIKNILWSLVNGTREDKSALKDAREIINTNNKEEARKFLQHRGDIF